MTSAHRWFNPPHRFSWDPAFESWTLLSEAKRGGDGVRLATRDLSTVKSQPVLQEAIRVADCISQDSARIRATEGWCRFDRPATWFRDSPFFRVSFVTAS